MRILISLLALLTLLPAQKKKIKFDESFDPSTLREPEIKLPIILRPDEPLPPEFLPTEAAWRGSAGDVAAYAGVVLGTAPGA